MTIDCVVRMLPLKKDRVQYCTRSFFRAFDTLRLIGWGTTAGRVSGLVLRR
jgi:hypothetical protein